MFEYGYWFKFDHLEQEVWWRANIVQTAIMYLTLDLTLISKIEKASFTL